MSTQRIEIYPGVSIEVNARLKRKAGVGRMKLVRNKLDDAERKRILGEVVRDSKPHRGYSTLILDEAAQLSESVGLKEASRITGVKFWSIVARKRILLKAGKITPFTYSKEQVKQCADLAETLVGKKVVVKVTRKMGKRSAFLEAGRILGMNGLSVLAYHATGKRGLAQHSKTRTAGSGSRTKATKPHAQ